MRTAGESRVIISLLSSPRLTVRAYLAVLPTLIRREEQTEIYRIYVTDALRAQGEGKYLVKRYADLITEKPVIRKTYGQIVSEVIEKCGLVVETT